LRRPIADRTRHKTSQTVGLANVMARPASVSPTCNCSFGQVPLPQEAAYASETMHGAPIRRPTWQINAISMPRCTHVRRVTSKMTCARPSGDGHAEQG
jgi:hypothetical protein